MAIETLIIHKLERFQEDQPAALRLAEQAIPVGADYEALFSQLKKLFQFKAGKLFGQFDPAGSTAALPAWLKEHHEGKLPFEKLSHMYAEQLKSLVDITSESFDGYVLCLLETRADGDRFYIFILESVAGLTIDRDLKLDTVEPLNTSKLDLALRIDLTDWIDSSEEPYLCMVKARGAGKIGEAFSQSVAFLSSIDSAKETETLMEVLAQYTKETPAKEAADVRQKAYEFCVEQQQLGESVPLSELSGYLDENQPTKFAQYAEQTAQLDGKQNLHPDTRKLKHLVRISGKGNGMSLSFSSDLIQETILFDEQSDTLTITAIPKALKKQILEHLKEQANRDQQV